MTTIYQNKYPSSFRGTAIQEIYDYGFLKVYSQNYAVNQITNALQTVASQNGYALLEVRIDYSPGIPYDKYRVTVVHVPPVITPSGYGTINLGIQSMFAYVALLEIVAGVLIAFLIYSSLVQIKEIAYGPEGTGGGVNSIVGAAMVLGVVYLFTKIL